MRKILAHPVFRRLFAAQVIALLGTGLLTIALGLLAYQIAGADAGVVLGIALTLKMVAYVGLSPLMTAVLARAPRRAVLVGADAVRALAALSLPFITELWQIYLAIFVLQAASATFSPVFQATIPDVLPQEEDYTRALSLSRLAYDLESLASPVLAGLLLTVLAPSALFGFTAVGFLGSALLILGGALPAPSGARDRPFRERVLRGSRIYFATPRLRGLFALGGTVSAVGAIVIVQSVVVAQSIYGGSERDLALLLGAYGLGSMAVALALPQVLQTLSDRSVMLPAAVGLAVAAMALGGWVLAFGWPSWAALLVIWLLLGAMNSAILLPAGRLLRRSSHAEDRPAIFAAQFALSHAMWLLAYPLAGLIGARLGVDWGLVLLGLAGLVAALAAWRLWPAQLAAELEHSHADLPPGHPHLQDAVRRGGRWVHRHAFVIDDEHRVWPTSG